MKSYHILIACFCSLILEVLQTQATQCRLNLDCGGTDGNGHGGAGGSTEGVIGPKGNKGDKGDDCQCFLQSENEVMRLREELGEGCPQTKYHFPNTKQTSNYIRVKTPIRQLSEVTICAWITPSSGKFNMGYFSYATAAHSNALLLWLDKDVFYLYHLDREKRYSISVRRRTHLCVTIDPPIANLYVDGTLTTTLTYSDSTPVDGGGALIIGQDQDSLMGGFDEDQAFRGTIENMMLWYRSLSAGEIRNVTTDACACPRDWSIALTPDVVELEGAVTAQPTEGCL